MAKSRDNSKRQSRSAQPQPPSEPQPERQQNPESESQPEPPPQPEPEPEPERQPRPQPHHPGSGSADEALRLTDGLVLGAREGRVTLENPATGATAEFAREDLPILERFLDWVTPGELAAWALEGESGERILNRSIEVLRDLLAGGHLISRREDLKGGRLPNPGAGWADAMHFLLATRTSRSTMFAPPAEFNAALAEKAQIGRQASAFLEYPEAPFRPLSPARERRIPGDATFLKAMLGRRTARRYADRPLTEAEMATILYYGWGMTRSVPNPLGDVFVRKTSPSGGSLHPIEVYPIVLNVEDVPPGCYHYSVRRHGLEQLWEGDPRRWIAFACGDQRWVEEAPLIVLCTAFLPRTAWKYDYSRVARAVLSEVGFAGQSALLTASWLGLGSFTTLALRDELFEELLGFDPLRQPVLQVFGMGPLEPDIGDHARPRDEAQPEGGSG